MGSPVHRQCPPPLGAKVPTWMMLLLELLESAPTYTVKKGVARYVPDTILSTSMKLLWFQEPVTFHPPICRQTDPVPQGGMGSVPKGCPLPGYVKSQTGDVLGTSPTARLICGWPPTLSMSSMRGWEPSSSILCSLRQDR